MDLRQLLSENIKPTSPIKPMINIGALLDIPTGEYVTGINGESLLNGGLGYLTGFTGIGNNFKSTNMHHQACTAMARMGSNSVMQSYDTEVNIHETRLKKLAGNVPEFHGEDIIGNGRWVVTDPTVMMGDVWYDKWRDYVNAKRKNADKLSVETPFLDRDGSPMKIIQPTFTEVDSFSKFMTNDVVKMSEENALGESGANTIFMRQGLHKNRVMMEVPSLTAAASDYMLMSAHVGDEFNMDLRNPPPKKLQYMPPNIKLKGVTSQFTYHMSNLWICRNASPLRNDGTKAPEFPMDQDDDMKGDTDLSSVVLQQLRSKSGPTGLLLTLVVSQRDGVLPALSEFYHIKTNGRFGLVGNDRNYTLAFCPDIALSRTVVRGKLATLPRLQRAANILSEMRQIYDLWKGLPKDLICTAEELYSDLIKLGYKWDELLETRPWWSVKGVTDVPYLSTMDLLRMRRGDYIPFWMKNPPSEAVAKRKHYFETNSGGVPLILASA